MTLDYDWFIRCVSNQSDCRHNSSLPLHVPSVSLAMDILETVAQGLERVVYKLPGGFIPPPPVHTVMFLSETLNPMPSLQCL